MIPQQSAGQGTAVVILNYNGKKWLEKFLPAVIQHSGAAKIIVADNGSSDGSLSVIPENVGVIDIGKKSWFLRRL